MLALSTFGVVSIIVCCVFVVSGLLFVVVWLLLSGVMCCGCWLLIFVRCVFVVVACRGSLFIVECWFVVRFVVRCLLLFAVLVSSSLLCVMCWWLLFVVVVRGVFSIVSWLFLLDMCIMFVCCCFFFLCWLSYVGAGVCVFVFGLFCGVAASNSLSVRCWFFVVVCCCVWSVPVCF